MAFKLTCPRVRVMLGLTVVVAVLGLVATTGIWNPFPFIGKQLGNWWSRVVALSDPLPAWTLNAKGRPDVSAVIGGQVIIGSYGYVEAYSIESGKLTWDRKVHFTLPAGELVVVRARPENPDGDPSPDLGYSVLEPESGAALWSDTDSQAVWVYSDAILDLTCPEAGDCRLRCRALADGQVSWTTNLPAGARVMRGANPDLVGVRDPAEWFAPAAAGSPGPKPPVLGLNANGHVYLVDTFRGRYVREVAAPDRQTEVAIAGDRVLFVHAARGASGCAYSVEALEYESGEPRWREDGYDLDTASGAGCEQRHAPLSAGGQLLVSGLDGRQRLIRVSQGEQKWVGKPGERLLATDGEFAAVSGTDRQTVDVLDLERDGQAAAWTYRGGLDPQAAITSRFVFIHDRDKQLLLVRSRIDLSGLLSVKTDETLIGYGETGIILASGRRIGYVPSGTYYQETRSP